MAMYEAQRGQLDRRQKLLDLLTQQAITPKQTQMVGDWAVPMSGMEGMTQLAQAYMGRKGSENIQAEREALAEKEQLGAQDAMREMMDKLQGRPESAPESVGGMPAVGPTRPAQAPDIIGGAMMSADPRLEGNKPAQMIAQAMLKQKMGGSERSPYFTPEDVAMPDGEGGYIVQRKVLNRRTGEYVDKGTERISKDDPRVHGLRAKLKEEGKGEALLGYKPKLEYATTTAKKKAERAHGMAGIGDIIADAQTEMDRGVATESGFGALIDYGLRFLGTSTEATQSAAKLEAIGGALTGKMPRFEGPQSDYDREYYQQMAGRIGVRSIPLKDRKFALEEVKRLWEKYDVSKSKDSKTKATGKKPADLNQPIWDAMTPEEQALF